MAVVKRAFKTLNKIANSSKANVYNQISGINCV